jgi:hypothetical protein
VPRPLAAFGELFEDALVGDGEVKLCLPCARAVFLED